MSAKAEQPLIEIASAKEWRAWLQKNHAKSDGVWLKFQRKGAAAGALTYAEAVEEALCFGWIDGQNKRIDAAFWMQRYTPRRARSVWSKINRARAEALIEAGKMRAAGLSEVERAKADGRWDAAYDSPSKSTPPDDLVAALAKNKKAKAFFEKLNSQNRYAILHRVQTAVKLETRAARIEKFVAMLAKGETIYPQ